jgi:hypothetical protein
MLPFSKSGRVLVAAALSALTSAATAQGSGGEKAYAMPAIEVAAQPLYASAPARMEGGGAPGVEPVLVPLPPGVWAAMSGLAGLAMVAVWRKHRLREE